MISARRFQCRLPRPHVLSWCLDSEECYEHCRGRANLTGQCFPLLSLPPVKCKSPVILRGSRIRKEHLSFPVVALITTSTTWSGEGPRSGFNFASRAVSGFDYLRIFFAFCLITKSQPLESRCFCRTISIPFVYFPSLLGHKVGLLHGFLRFLAGVRVVPLVQVVWTAATANMGWQKSFHSLDNCWS